MSNRKRASAAGRRPSLQSRRSSSAACPGQREGAEAAQAAEAAAVDLEKLASPDRAVGAVAGAVEGQGQGPLQPVLRHGRQRVRVMVLHPELAGLREALRQAAGVVEGVQVEGHRFRPDSVQLQDALHLVPEVGLGQRVLQVADEGGQVHVGAAGQGGSVLQIAAQAQGDPGHGLAEGEQAGHVAPGTAQKHRHPARAGRPEPEH
jgi:hypothetical protein